MINNRPAGCSSAGLFMFLKNKFMRLIILFICIALSFEMAAQKVKYKKTPSGLRYCVVHDAPGNAPGNGDVIFFKSWIYKVEKGKTDSLIHQSDDGGVLISSEFRKGSIEEGVRTLSPGDSVIYLINVDSFFTQNNMKEVPPFLNKTQDLKFIFKAMRVASKDEIAKEMAERDKALVSEKLKQAELYKKEALADEAIKQQLVKDDAVLQEYFKKNNIKVERTSNGVYYQILKSGNGSQNVVGEKVKVFYTGKLLDGTLFDSNVGQGNPFTFTLGIMEVIMGWDEGVSFLKKGDKAILYIPSALAYGEQGAGGAIPPNASLIFEVEIVE
jgi:FKBP-type peptidyl-prolyl cis-trans isomerase FkpA